jgi:outer membrane protein OmpA-like peptidoglycan-associated protein
MLLALASGTAHAQKLQGDNVQLFVPTTGGYGFFTREYAEVGESFEPYVGLWVDYARAPLVRYVNGKLANEVISHQLTVDLVGSISLFHYVELGLGVPFVPFQSGAGLPATTTEAARNLAAGAFGDIWVTVKAPFLRTKHANLAAALAVTFPSGDHNNFDGEQSVTGVPRLISDFRFVNERLIFGVDAGVRLRQNATLGNINFRDELAFGANLAYAIIAERFYAGLEFYGAAGFRFKSTEETPIDALLGLKYRLNKFVFSLGGGTGVTDGYGTPRFRVVAGVAFFPQKAKTIEPESEPVPEPEPVPAPEPPPPPPKVEPKVEITREKIAISDKVYFEFDSDRINPVSFPLLNKVADVILKHARLKRIRVEGHTDNVGGDTYNMDLSSRRARSVMSYLVGRNVQASRLTSRGYGFRKPKASNATPRGRAINRRVEFIIELQEVDPNEFVPVHPSFEEGSTGEEPESAKPPPGYVPPVDKKRKHSGKR